MRPPESEGSEEQRCGKVDGETGVTANEKVERGVRRQSAVEERGENERGGRELVGRVETGGREEAPLADRIAGLGVEGGARRLVRIHRAGEHPGQRQRCEIGDGDGSADPRGAAQVAREERPEDRHPRDQRVRFAQRDEEAEEHAAQKIGPRPREEALRPPVTRGSRVHRFRGAASGQRQHETGERQRDLQ